jgi:hypothetical protein
LSNNNINFNKHWNHGLEFRIFDWFPESRIEELFRLLIWMCDEGLSAIANNGSVANPHNSALWNAVMARCVWTGAVTQLTPEEAAGEFEHFGEDAWGPRLAPLIFTDIRKKLTLEPQFENRILESGMPLPVHPMDEDVQHLQEHMKQFQETGDIHGTLREHMLRHQMQMQQPPPIQQSMQHQPQHNLLQCRSQLVRM